MRQVTKTGVAVGAGLVAVAAVGGIVAYKKGLFSAASASAPNVAYSPAPPWTGPSRIAAVATWQNAGNVAATFAVQGFIVEAPPQPAVVGGHWWTSPAIDAQALAAYQAGQSSVEAAMAAVPANRVVLVTVPAKGTGSATLFASLAPTPGELFVFLVQPAAKVGALIVADPLGTAYASIAAPKGVAVVRTRVVSS